MRPEQIKEQISRLGLLEKLLLVEDIWDSIARDNDDVPLPEWQKQELDRRYQEFDKDNLDLHGWKSVHEHLRDEYR